MNIWLINHYANPPDEPGDARHYSHARELIRRGHRVRVVTCNFNHSNRKHTPISPGSVWESRMFADVPFTLVGGRSYRGNSLSRLLNMAEFSARVWKREWALGLAPPDLILGSSPHPFAALAAERLSASYGVPFFLEVRDLWPYVLTEVGGHSKYHPFVILVDQTMRHLYQRAARIVMFSRDSGDLMARYGADPKKIVWVPHGVDLTLSPAPKPAPSIHPFTVTYAGAHNQWNSLDAILDAAKILQREGRSNILIRFVGDGACKPALVNRTKQENISLVRFDDPVPKRQVPEKVLDPASAFIINNRKDGVSKGWMSFNKLYEYLAAARPVVFGACTENDPVRESGAGISVEADNPEQLANGIDFLASRSLEQLHDYGKRGRRWVEENYSIPILVDRFVAAVMDCVPCQQNFPLRKSS